MEIRAGGGYYAILPFTIFQTPKLDNIRTQNKVSPRSILMLAQKLVVHFLRALFRSGIDLNSFRKLKTCHMRARHRGVPGLKIRVGKKHDDVVCVKWVDWHLCARSIIARVLKKKKVKDELSTPPPFMLLQEFNKHARLSKITTFWYDSIYFIHWFALLFSQNTKF